ncbi:MAG: acetyl-CoA carboxylase biotin carboxyl carrier protein [Candidatus Omnitrophota bacterium]
MNLKEIKEIIKLMNENELTEVEVEREGAKLKLKKGSQMMAAPSFQAAAPVIHNMPVASSPSPVAAQQSVSGAATAGVEIASPMVGTFYRAPSPESAPFVEIGQIVDIGQVVCIVEAMKLMNEIKSEIKGKVADVLVNNAEPVEFGQPLFLVEPV